ncbi:glycerate kinase type-2 family protein [Aquabacterium sp. OR-4]|uniref:glycerate kinase type-2 family protein n=1 Tax=Aquabacterium sp. OR-4 TaxID=2978127 RepID=UPI0021B4A1BE|nr:glycerate kinase [Aquabacterium sp. OR-4]MDT7837104.1 glycerate kinase [Aquabacterium sp. OR-4]
MNAAIPTDDAQARALLRTLFDAAVARAQPAQVMGGFLPVPPDPARGRTLVLGAGKAGGAMAAAVDALWPADAPLSGLVITRYGHVPPACAARPGRIAVVEAAHPVPDAAGLAASARLMALTQGLTEHDLVLCLISGGGSALLTQPAAGLTLADKQALNKALLNSGAAIDEMNTVRKHLSAVKGGRLAALCAPARVVTLLISDVPGDEPAVIASGPTVPDASTCADALAILDRYGIALPPAARAGLESAAFESPKPGDACFARGSVALIATPRQSLQAAAEAARAAGLAAHVLGDDLEGESRCVGQVHAALARSVARHGEPFARPCVILSGGETTVTVRHARPGRGGRAGEFLLGAALALQGQAGVWALAADTDGIDGVEDNAGALVTPDTLARAAAAGLTPGDSLARHDAYGFFSALGDLVHTGPTFTNVNDFRALLVL